MVMLVTVIVIHGKFGYGCRKADGSRIFGRPFVKRFAVCYRTVVCPVLSVSLPCLCVYNVGVLWPNGWMDQDETWRGGKPQPRPHCIRWGPRSPPLKGHSPQFSAHVCCGQMAGWIKILLGMEVGRPWPRPHCFRWGPMSPPRGTAAPRIFGPCPLCQMAGWIKMPLGTEVGFGPGDIVHN